MSDDKKIQVAETLSRLCFREVNDEETCPVGGCDNCPFPDTLCEDITPEDWLEWMEATND